MKIATSYFYQIRNFKPWMIPVSTAISDPAWYRPPQGQEYYFDKRGIICGLRYEYLVVQHQATIPCMGEHQLCPFWATGSQCMCMQEYRDLLEKLDFDRIIKAFQYCANKFHRPFDDEEPIVVLMVHEAWNNPCSERRGLQDYFTIHGWSCQELKYPIE